jgi:hypothetical protein
VFFSRLGVLSEVAVLGERYLVIVVFYLLKYRERDTILGCTKVVSKVKYVVINSYWWLVGHDFFLYIGRPMSKSTADDRYRFHSSRYFHNMELFGYQGVTGTLLENVWDSVTRYWEFTGLRKPLITPIRTDFWKPLEIIRKLPKFINSSGLWKLYYGNYSCNGTSQMRTICKPIWRNLSACLHPLRQHLTRGWTFL